MLFAAFALAFVLSSVPLLQIVLFGITIAALSLARGWLTVLLGLPSFVFLGHVSYAVYMIHFPIIKLIQNFNAIAGLEGAGPWAAHAMVVLWALVITGCASTVYLFYEKPVQRWLRSRWTD